MSTAVKQFHEEEAIGKTYDFQVARRLLRYLKPYVRFLIPALVFTLLLNLFGTLQPKFTQYAIDWYILPKTTVAMVPLTFRELFLGSFRVTVTLFALVYVAVQLARFVFWKTSVTGYFLDGLNEGCDPCGWNGDAAR